MYAMPMYIFIHTGSTARYRTERTVFCTSTLYSGYVNSGNVKT